MKDNQWLFSQAYARNTDPQTSHEAAQDISGSRATKLEQIVLDAIRAARDGLTNHELVEKTGYTWNTITPRVRPLVNKGFVMDSGLRRKGPTNKSCIVWKAV